MTNGPAKTPHYIVPYVNENKKVYLQII